ncbi:MAG TPA: dihydrodipicolinate reductase C-terminal domain-containing protein [Candidatus Acidoferrum sp.]|nr:dihydrodipicolinate reductase C-terminal domain-containing protein [Candidatus Acidoferrum sp.]
MTLRIAIVGHGKMGQTIARLAPEHDCEVVRTIASAENADGKALTRESLQNVDVAIEFTAPQSAPQNLRRLIEAKIATVVGTTGWIADLQEIRELARARDASVVWGPNFSVGLHHFRRTLAEAARRFAREENYGAWGWEIHHAAKKDELSGTLLALAEEMTRNGYLRPVSLGANRAGAVFGTHEIGFDSFEDTITIRHQAKGREGFARGALRAARWLTGKKGFFEFREIADELP